MFKVCVFAGARGTDHWQADARYIGQELARRQCHVFYGGSSKGVMGALADGVMSVVGGKITGVLPEKIAALKHYRPDIEIVSAKTMAERKAVFWNCDSFLCLPGGLGTMDELFEIWTLTKLGYQEHKPIVVFNQYGFYDPLRSVVNKMVDNRFMTHERSGMVLWADTANDAIDLTTQVRCDAVKATEE